MDSEFHRVPPPDNPTYKYVHIDDILKSSQYGISIKMNETDEGYPIYRMNEIHDMLTDIDLLKCADVDRNEADKYLLKDRDVLFNRTNSQKFVGRTGLHKKVKKENKIFASYLIRLEPNKNKVLPEYLTAFLNSKTGIWDIKRRARISINQSNVNAEEVKAIRIPLLSYDLQFSLKKCFDKAYTKRIKSIKIYEEAENLLEESFDINNFDADSGKINIKSFSGSFLKSERLDSEYYLPKYDSYKNVIQDYKNGSGKIQHICEIKNTKFYPEEDKIYNYIELSNIGSSGEITSCTQELGKDLPTRARRKVNTGDVIISSIEGSLKSCALITEEYNEALCSTGFFVLKSESINSETFLVLFKSKLMQEILKRNCTGTILTSLNNADFENIEIPLIEFDIQNKIKENIQLSFKLRDQAKKLLKTAKTAVEIAIEKNEEAAFSFIEDETKEFDLAIPAKE